MRDQLRRVDHAPCSRPAALHFERHDRPAAALLALRQRVLRVRSAGRGSSTRSTAGCPSSQRGELERRADCGQHAQLERLQALEQHPGVERRRASGRRCAGRAPAHRPPAPSSRHTAPPITRPCPSRYLVAEWITMSAPSSSGRCSAGVQNTLSTTSSAPALLRDRAPAPGCRRPRSAGWTASRGKTAACSCRAACSHSSTLVGET